MYAILISSAKSTPNPKKAEPTAMGKKNKSFTVLLREQQLLIYD
jgi:hypothetical protein